MHWALNHARAGAPPDHPARRRRRAGAPGITAGLVLGTAALAAPALGAGPAGAMAATTLRPNIPPINLVWGQTLPDNGAPIALSSPNVASLPGGPSVVVGDRAGLVWAFHLADGSGVPGWPYHTGGVAVDSSPSVAPAGGGLDNVYVGVGNSANPGVGGYQAISPGGGDLWFQSVVDPGTDLQPFHAVQASMAVGNLQGGTEVVAPSVGQETYAMDAGSGGVLGGFPWFQGDADFATPALADLYHNGSTEIVDAADSSPGLAYGVTYQAGGLLRIISPSGNAGTGAPGGGQICQYQTNQSLGSSAAVGEFLGTSSEVAIAFWTSSFFPGASDTNKVIAVDSHCNFLWSASLDGLTGDSPALADVLGNGQLQVVEGTNFNNNASGTVYVLNGSNGSVAWSAPTFGAVIGSITTADLSGQGYQDLLVPTTQGVEILDGRTGADLGGLFQNMEAFQSSPLVTNDPNGTIGITIAGYNNQNQGVVDHYELANAGGINVNESGAWPQFHHDPALTGDAGTPFSLQVPCKPPPVRPYGYYMVGLDGGVFNFGNLPFCGSTGAIALNQPVVGIAATHDAGGYWEVARDGGLFAFGDAGAYNSLPGLGVAASNVVGIVPTATGGGYWMIGSDGGAFAFGDAGFVGSLPGVGVHVNDIVGIVPTKSGRGYWMVGRDGGVFAFGDAGFVGSLPGIGVSVSNIVGIVPTPSGRGYWMVGNDGGVFAFGDAGFVGSLPGVGVHVTNVVGITPSPSGRGYLMVGTDGGIFAFGDAPYDGSLPALGVHVNDIISVAGAP
ncbi:MAG TPA: hypothetical protein VKG43_10800 [Acidimicrobiales bacterium]|nr:hypothetical protein [Acidimicrobiales bacterium]